jgi:hypothetical protein
MASDWGESGAAGALSRRSSLAGISVHRPDHRSRGQHPMARAVTRLPASRAARLPAMTLVDAP